MIKLYFLLFTEFLKIGVFALGGGYATLPFLYYLQGQYNWFTLEELTNLIAVSNITPGPIGINMATYTGYTTAGVLGSFIATFSIVLIPSIIVMLMTKLYSKFQSCKSVNDVFLGLRPAACALLASIGLKLFCQNIIYTKNEWSFPFHINYQALILFLILIIPFSFFKKNPLLTILLGAIGGIVIKSF